MDDELELFIREQKERVAQDRASLEQDPPYMEVTTKAARGFGSTVKENIPPKISTHSRDGGGGGGGGGMALPLGIEYDRKKQKLQQELRLDYRHYMAQKNQLSHAGPLTHLENWSSVKQRAASRRDAATLTEERAELWDRGAEPRGRRPVGGGHSGGTDERLEDGKLRHSAVQDEAETRRSSRDRREVLLSGKAGRRSRPLTNEDAEFATGLIIGAADSEAALRKRKERYRLELQEQIAEQHRNKRREKDLELKVAATGANDPEKPPDRIRQFGLQRRKDPPAVEVAGSTGGQRSPSGQGRDKKTEAELPPQQLPPVAFQSPLLDYYASVGGASLVAASQPPIAVEPHRVPMFHPHPAYRGQHGDPYHCYGTQNLLNPNMAYYGQLPAPAVAPPMMCWNSPPGETGSHQLAAHSSLSLNHENGSSFPEPHTQSGSKTAEDSLFSDFPSERGGDARERMMSYREALNQQEASGRRIKLYNQLLGCPVPESQTRTSSLPVVELKYRESSLTSTHSEDLLNSNLQRASTKTFRCSMNTDPKSTPPPTKTKIQDQQERRLRERKEAESLEAKLEAEMKSKQPWGRGGGGAPLKDSTGNLIADLKQMHKLNEEAYSNPKQSQIPAVVAARPVETPQPKERVSGFALVQTPQFARGAVFSEAPPQQKLQEQDQYKSFLKQQIEEKMRRKAEEKEKIRVEEEKEEKRLKEQLLRIQKEYEEEQEKKKQKDLEQQAKNEELIQLAEQRRREAERRRKEVEEEEQEESATLRRQRERREVQVQQVHREPSPPVPTLQRKLGRPQCGGARTPTLDTRPSPSPSQPPPSDRPLPAVHSPPVPARRNQLRAAAVQPEVLSGLTALRQQLHNQHKHLEERMQQWEEPDSPLSDRPGRRPPVDVFDMAMLRLPVSVRRPDSRKVDPRNLSRIHDSLQLRPSADRRSTLAFSEAAPQEEVGVATRRGRHSRRLDQQSEDDYFDLSPPSRRDHLGSAPGGSARGSLLQSESAFIDPLAEVFPGPRTPEAVRAAALSARQRRRRRLSRPSQQPQDLDQLSHYPGDLDQRSHYRGDVEQRSHYPGDLEQRSHYPVDLDQRSHYPGDAAWRAAPPRDDGRNRSRTAHLVQQNRTGAASILDLDESPPLGYSPTFDLRRMSSADSVATEPWMRPGTSDSFRGLGRASHNVKDSRGTS